MGKHKYCNHQYDIDENHTIVDFGDGKFVANNEAVPLLKALSDVGLRTRTHNIDKGEIVYISILLDNVQLEIKEVFERDAERTKYNGKKELFIYWRREIK